MKKHLLVAAMVSVAVGANSLYLAEHENQQRAEFILQGAKPSSIITEVNKVGGQVLHEYSVIDAVSVKLSDEQLSRIKVLNPLIRSFKGQDIKVSSAINTFDSEHLGFDVKKRTATWNGINSSGQAVTINSIALSLPSKNKQLRGLKINGKTIPLEGRSVEQNIQLPQDALITLNAGESVNVELTFSRLKSVDTDEYQVSFGQLSSTAASDYTADYSDSELTQQQAQSVAGKFIADVDTSSVSWSIANTDKYEKQLSTLELAYPRSSQALMSIEINGKETLFSINGDNQIILDENIEVKGGNAISVKASFSSLSSVLSEDYQLLVNYRDGDASKVVVPAGVVQSSNQRDTFYPSIVRADLAHQRGITGYGVTVAVLDTGFKNLNEITRTTNGGKRDITTVDVLGKNNWGHAKRNDFNGHGTHLISIITNSSKTIDANGDYTGGYNGIAPDVNLVAIKAFDEEGQSSYSAILNALEYVVTNKDVHNIKVLNLSFSALPSSYYWDDPLNKALMKAWDAGITVVAAAGNRGSDAMTIGVPGNNPYVITVGATSDNYTPYDLNDDFVTSFSSAGPTYEGFVKPEVVAPGGRIQGLMDKNTLIRETYYLYNDKQSSNHDYFELSGTSQSTAVTTGIVALMLQANPNLTPDDIKCRLIDTARSATSADGQLAFSIFQQGAGLVSAVDAIDSTASGCGNAGLKIAKEIAGEEHFIGPTRLNEMGEFYIPGIEGLSWSGVYTDSQLWRNSGFDVDSQLWRNSGFDVDSQLWRNSGFDVDSQLWRNSGFDVDSQLWRNSGFDVDSQLWRNSGFDVDSQLWRNSGFDVDSQLWRNSGFDVDSQLWRDTAFNSDSIVRDWVNHE